MSSGPGARHDLICHMVQTNLDGLNGWQQALPTVGWWGTFAQTNHQQLGSITQECHYSHRKHDSYKGLY